MLSDIHPRANTILTRRPQQIAAGRKHETYRDAKTSEYLRRKCFCLADLRYLARRPPPIAASRRPDTYRGAKAAKYLKRKCFCLMD